MTFWQQLREFHTVIQSMPETRRWKAVAYCVLPIVVVRGWFRRR